ncbi:MAG: helix-turn-helix domain-containing protein [Acetatifactor sp.]|nr:helix-turn-helix domain-containing protein [Acetatifactor sp.]
MRTTNKKRLELDIDKPESVVKVGKAISSEIRLEILKYLTEHSANISEIAKEFDIPQSSAAMHAKVLEDAGMIVMRERPGVRGSQKMCGIVFEDMYMNVFEHRRDPKETSVFSFPMPIGNYFECDVDGNCGLASAKGYLGLEDSPSSFYCVDRSEAELLWFRNGFVEYRFPTYLFKEKKVKEIRFSFEICSEAPGYQNDWPSDVSVWVNGRELETMLIPGDFGGRRGVLNPDWWGDTMTQYGILKNIRINNDGVFDNETKVSDENMESLDLDGNKFISFRLGVKADAAHVGGLNLFGCAFGDHPQGLLMDVEVYN